MKEWWTWLVIFLAAYVAFPQVRGSSSPRYVKPSSEDIKKRLTAEQFRVTQEDGTEPAFRNAYWDLKDPGIYVDIVTGEPLFSSLDKYDSGTGWPSFTKPIESGVVTEHEDKSLFTTRTEVRSKIGQSHLGHVFTDGPKPTGLRYCMNSAAMRFIPTKDLDKEGYAAYAALFKPVTPRAQNKRAVFAGGCFWCMEPPFDQTKGVISVTSGYSGGKKANPTYKEVSSGGTGHYEVIEVLYDPTVVSYSQLLGVFWRQIDPLDNEGQFCDKGPQYRSGIFVSTPEERVQAEQSKAELQKSARFSKQKIVTEVMDASVFYPAEEYHQKYYQKNPIRYKYYRTSCGRDKRLEQVWGL